jgi:hypothetical protein
VVAAGGLYTLVVTFARAAYASATAAMLVAAVVASLAARRRGARVGAFVVPLALLLAVGTAVMTSARDARFMEHRLDRLHRDFAERLAEWHEGVALRDPGVATALFGMGLGRFAHTALVRRPGGRFPTDVTLPNESRRAFLHVRAGLPLYLGQKVHVAEHQLYRVRATVRTRDHGVLVVFLCEKLLLYSIHCRDIAFAPEATGAWERVDGILPSGRIGERAVHRFTRPVELSLFVPDRGTTLDIAEVSLTDTNGRELLVNGNFAHGLERWLPTDDDHKIWRIENQYLMTFFEGGALGLTALLVLAAVAMWRALHAATRGDPAAPALAASLTAVLLSSLFDCPLEVPRLAALFYLVAFAALALGERPVLCAAA